MRPLISVVTPVYKAENIVDELVKQIVSSVSTITDNFEILLVCDGSPDASWEKIVQNCRLYPQAKGIKLSKNFGQEYAIMAGLNESKGEWVVVMDCDLQDNPNEIPNLYAKAQEGFEVVFGQRVQRKDSLWKKMQARMFYALYNYLTNTKQDANIGNFGIFHRKVIESVLAMNDSVRCFTTMITWVGFNKTTIPVVHEKRYEGQSSYSFGKLLNLSQDIIVSFSNKPLSLMVKFGFLLSICSFLVGIYYLVQYLLGITDVSGYTSLIISLWLIAGLLIMFMGVLGIYLSKIFDNTKQRPRYIIQEKINFDDVDHQL